MSRYLQIFDPDFPALVSPVSVVLLHHALDELPVAGVEVDLGADLHPADGRRVIPGLERELADLTTSKITKITMAPNCTLSPVSSWKLRTTVSIQALSVFLGSST